MPEVVERARRTFGANVLGRRRSLWLGPLLKIVANPLVLILLVASAASVALGQKVEAAIIVTVVLISSTLDFVQSYRSSAAAERLRSTVSTRIKAVRQGQTVELPIAQVVPGDVVLLEAGAILPGDGIVLEGRDLHLNEAALTGEAMPVEKEASVAGDPRQAVFMGSSVISGTGRALIVATGLSTQFGRTAEHLQEASPQTAFERGIADFGRLVLGTVVILVAFVFAANVWFQRPWLESLLFSVALAVGLTPEFLPMIITVSLSAAAVRMAKARVIVKFLPAIENLGQMDILASDKTGTLTEGRIVLERHVDPFGTRDAEDEVLKWASINSALETGIRSPLDEAILAHDHPSVAAYSKVDELPFDFLRRRLSVVAQGPEGRVLVCKGAPESVLSACTTFRLAGEAGARPLDALERKRCVETFESLSREGFRALAVARGDGLTESELCLVGFAAFLDPPRASARETLQHLQQDGIAVKVLTGDNELLTQKICRDVGLDASRILLGAEIEAMDDETLGARIEEINIFARVSPDQKNRLVRLMMKRGHVVGYLGDGINDAPSLKTADVGISVDTAVDVARETADVILLERSLEAVHLGVLEGRRSFANITKYLLMGTSSNFGNMLSMAAASLFLKFLPLLPAQLLLNNFLYDLSQLPLPGDRVDEGSLRKPRPWNLKLVRSFMLVLGPVSSLYDALTFVVLLFYFRAGEALFHTGWFMESLVTQVLVIFVIRTARAPWASRPSPALTVTALGVVAVALAVPYLPLAAQLGFVAPPPAFFVFLALTVTTYLTLVEAVKRYFFRRHAVL